MLPTNTVPAYITSPIAIIEKVKEKQEPPKLYTIKAGDNLTRIAEAQGTSVERLWEANPELTNPDVLAVADPLKIPENEEQLTDRPMPVTIQVQSISPTSQERGFSSSGGFDTTLGWCTNYIARRRPIPAWFQNADMWLINARQAGMPTGTTPQVGAVAVAASYMHVAYVEDVKDGQVYVSEMNYSGTPGGGYGKVSYRWTPLSEWQGYIY